MKSTMNLSSRKQLGLNPLKQVFTRRQVFQTVGSILDAITGFQVKNKKKKKNKSKVDKLGFPVMSPTINKSKNLNPFNYKIESRVLEFGENIWLHVDTSSNSVKATFNNKTDTYVLGGGLQTSQQFAHLNPAGVCWKPVGIKISIISNTAKPVLVDNVDNIHKDVIIPNMYGCLYSPLTSSVAEYMIFNKPSFIWNPSSSDESVFHFSFNNDLLIPKAKRVFVKMNEDYLEYDDKPRLKIHFQDSFEDLADITSDIKIARILIQYKLRVMVQDTRSSSLLLEQENQDRVVELNSRRPRSTPRTQK